MRKNDFDTLSGCILFRGVPEEQVKELTRKYEFTVKDFAKNENIFTPDSFSRCLGIILRGSAAVTKCKEKNPMLMSILAKGSIFGMATLFYEPDEFLTTVSAKENVKILFISKNELLCIFNEYPAIVNNYINVLSERIHYLNRKIDRLTNPSPENRVLNYLLTLRERYSSNEFSLPLSVSELASALSLGRTSVYRAFDELISKGVLSRDGKKICLLNTERID